MATSVQMQPALDSAKGSVGRQPGGTRRPHPEQLFSLSSQMSMGTTLSAGSPQRSLKRKQQTPSFEGISEL